MFQYSQQRQNQSSDGFRKLEIQIASIIFALSVVFVDNVIGSASYGDKLIFTYGLFGLILSLAFGLLNFHILEEFWDDITYSYRVTLDRWSEARKDGSYSEAREFERGVIRGKQKVVSPKWPWILQTAFLVLGVAFIFITVVRIIF